MRVIATIEGEDILEQSDGTVIYAAKAAIDSDGTGDHHGDRTAQDETSYKPDLNADVDRYIVVPPAIVSGVRGIVVGCQAMVTYGGKSTPAVVGDIGPHKKLGEISCATASALGIDPSPVDGGVDEHAVFYKLWPGSPAVVNGKTYTLQPHPNIK